MADPDSTHEEMPGTTPAPSMGHPMAAGGGEDPGAPARPQDARSGAEDPDDTRRAEDPEEVARARAALRDDASELDEVADVRVDLSETLEEAHSAMVRNEVWSALCDSMWHK